MRFTRRGKIQLVIFYMIWFGLVLYKVNSTIPEQVEEQPKAVVEQVVLEEVPEPKVEVEEEPILTELGTFKMTAYCSCVKCCGRWAENRPKDETGKDIVYTASGEVAKAGRTVAVDPNVIPFGSKIFVEYEDGSRYMYVAEDSGSAIKDSRIDVYFDNHEEALEFGVQRATVYIVN